MDYLEEIKDFLKVPNIEDFKRILIVQPHPDDADIAVGGTIAKLSSLGARTIYVTVTDGSLGTKDPNLSRDELKRIRMEEQERAAKVLGVDELIWLGFEDGGDYTYQEVRNRLVEILRDLKPDLVLTVDPTLRYEFHPDHIKTGRATAEATIFYQFPNFLGSGLRVEKSVKAIGFFFTPRPNTFVCTEGFFQKKMEAISKHESQFDEDGMKKLSMYLEKKESQFGKEAGCERAEAMRLMPIVMLHAFTESEIL